MIEVIRYECEYCNKKVYKSKSAAKFHEKKCFANPTTKACQTCKYYCTDYNTVYNPNHGGDPGSTDYDIKFSYCEMKEGTFEEELNYEYNCPLYSHGKKNF